MPDEPEEGFTIRDRRRFSMDEPAPDTAAADNAPAAGAGAGAASFLTAAPDDEDEEDAGFPAGAFGDGGPDAMGGMYGDESESALPDIYSVLALFLGELRNLAWLRMGLVANPATGQIERDMSQAKIAIDTVAFLAGQLESVVAPEERVPLKAMISDLQINFVEQSKRSS